jgi:hypothetical protein
MSLRSWFRGLWTSRGGTVKGMAVLACDRCGKVLIEIACGDCQDVKATLTVYAYSPKTSALQAIHQGGKVALSAVSEEQFRNHQAITAEQEKKSLDTRRSGLIGTRQR